MKIIIGADHGGINLKNEVVQHLKENPNITVTDIGTSTAESVDYPSYALEVSKQVANNEADFGILCCGTGIGMSIAANKFPGIRASVVTDTFSAEATRSHNNANILCLGERVTGAGLALKIVDIWLSTNFVGGRHQRRLEEIKQIEVTK